MKRYFASFVLGSAVLFIAGCQDDLPVEPVDASAALGAAAGSSVQGAGFDFEYTGHYIVGYDYMSPEAADFIEAAGGSFYRQWPEISYGEMGGLSEDDLDALRSLPGITSVTPDISIRWIPPVEEFGLETLDPSTETDQSDAETFAVWQWNLRQIDADDAWLTTDQGDDVTVAILDTGLDPEHEDQDGTIDEGNSASMISSPSAFCEFFTDLFFGLSDAATFFDFNFHGSFVGGIVTSNGIRIASVAPDAELIGVKVLNCEGFGSFADLNAGIIHAANVGADVINMSLGALLPREPEDEALEEAIVALIDFLQAGIDFAVENGVFVVAAAGNDGLNFDDLPNVGDCFLPSIGFGSGSCDDLDVIHIPSMLQNVLSVAASGPFQQANFDQLAFYTNFGQLGADVVAPGGNRQAGGSILDGIRSVCSTTSIFFFPVCFDNPTLNLVGANGTSFASPHAAGTAAVVISEGADPDACVEDGADRIEGQLPRERINVVGAAQCERLKVADDEV